MTFAGAVGLSMSFRGGMLGMSVTAVFIGIVASMELLAQPLVITLAYQMGRY